MPKLAEPKCSLFNAAGLRCCGQRQHSAQSCASAGSAVGMSQGSLMVIRLMCLYSSALGCISVVRKDVAWTSRETLNKSDSNG